MRLAIASSIFVLLFSAYCFGQDPMPVLSANWRPIVQKEQDVEVPLSGPARMLTDDDKLIQRKTREARTDHPENPSDMTAIVLLKEKIKDVLETLTDRERQVLEQRFGLVDGYSRTLEEVGRQFQVTRERIRQIEAKALRKMRHPTRIRQLEGFLEAPGI